jgi:hypothetical protein
MHGNDENTLADLEAFHREVDREAAALAARHLGRLRCGPRCAGCCLDGLTVLPVEAERIRRGAPAVLRERPFPDGGCAFLDPAGRCRVYPFRPYVCRTQGLPLRWFEEDDAGAIRERRDVCLLNLPGPPLEALDETDLWTIGPYEERLVEIQERFGGNAERVRLRGMFGEV